MAELEIPTAHHHKLYHVPPNFTRRVCMCKDPGPPLFDYEKRPSAINCCQTCRKPFRWNLRRCTICEVWFIKDFRRENSNCARHTKCLSCLESTETCCEFAAIPRGVSIFGPLGLNPREIPQELIDAVVDMPSVFD